MSVISKARQEYNRDMINPEEPIIGASLKGESGRIVLKNLAELALGTIGLDNLGPEYFFEGITAGVELDPESFQALFSAG